MRKGVVIVLMCLVAVGVLGVLLLSHQAEATTITVPDDYTTIHEAVENASDGDIVYVRAGTYSDWADIQVSNFTLQGESAETTKIVYNSSFPSFRLLCLAQNNVTVKGLNLTHEADYSVMGIKFGNCQDVTLEECIFYATDQTGPFVVHQDTVVIENSTNVMVRENLFHDTCDGRGIYEVFAFANHDPVLLTYPPSINYTFLNNTFTGTGGMVLYPINECQIIHNDFLNLKGPAVSVWGFTLGDAIPVTNITIKCNLFENCSSGLSVSLTGPNEIVSLSYCQNITITQNYFYNNTNKPTYNVTAIKFYTDTELKPTNTIIYNNNFINNSMIFYKTAPVSVDWTVEFDNGTVGNYYDNYTGTDADEDGIGDTPVEHDTTAIDNYPLMNPIVRCFEGEEPEEPEPGVFDAVIDISVAAMVLIIMFLVIKVVIMTIMHQGRKVVK